MDQNLKYDEPKYIVYEEILQTFIEKYPIELHYKVKLHTKDFYIDVWNNGNVNRMLSLFPNMCVTLELFITRVKGEKPSVIYVSYSRYGYIYFEFTFHSHLIYVIKN